ncbi:MAG TPA: PilZ domain-containing protein [Candidatus Polarisedimenticolia bacterium]|nr:PilZ domain-containing protein [Candidatus Polarisedimenticolia bacterium]
MSGKKVLWSEAIRSRVEHGKSHFLARSSLRALSAGNATVFLDIAATDRPDLIVLPTEQLEMPPADLCRHLRGDDRTQAIPILALAPDGIFADALWQAGATEVLDPGVGPQDLQERIAGMLGLRLRRFPRYEVVLPVARGRIFHEFLGYTNAVSEGGMGFETISRIRSGDHLPLRIYRNTEERPISVTGRVAGVRPNIDTGIGYAVGVEFMQLAQADRDRLLELFPRDSTLAWTNEAPPEAPPPGLPPNSRT